MVDRDPHSRKYFLGPLLYEFGLLAQAALSAWRAVRRAHCIGSPTSRRTRSTSASEADGSGCANRALRVSRSSRFRSISAFAGPLGVGAGGLAILCSLPAFEAQAVVVRTPTGTRSSPPSQPTSCMARSPRAGPRLLLSGRRGHARHRIDGGRLPAQQPGRGDQRRRHLRPPAAGAAGSHRAADASRSSQDRRGDGRGHDCQRRGNAATTEILVSRVENELASSDEAGPKYLRCARS